MPSDRAKLIGMVVCNVMLVLAGIAIGSYGLVRNLAVRKRLPQQRVATTLTTNGVISLCLGSANIALGSYGLVCSLIRSRWAVNANVLLLATSALGNAMFVIEYALEINQFVSSEQVEISVALVRAYGSNATRSSRRFTEAIDLIQQTYGCCDWGADPKGSIYIKTPWYRERSSTLTNVSQAIFPESCCTKEDSDCSAATHNLPSARKLGSVHRKDCMDVIVGRFMVSAGFVILQGAVGMVIPILCAVSPIFYVLENAAKA